MSSVRCKGLVWVTSVIAHKCHSFDNPGRGGGKRRIGWGVKVYIGCLCSCPQMPQLRQSKSGNYRSLSDGRKAGAGFARGEGYLNVMGDGDSFKQEGSCVSSGGARK